MKRSLTWDEVDSYYRKKPVRFKAVQLDLGSYSLPPDVAYMTNPDDNQEVLVLCQGEKVTPIKDGDWIVLEIETNKTYVLSDDIFSLVFEAAQ